MYMYKAKEKSSSLVPPKNISDRNCNQNSPWRSHRSSEPTQQLRALSYHGDKGVLQLQERDTVQIVSGKCGDDPCRFIGLTCHHIIPASILESFYYMCQRYTRNPQIKSSYLSWIRRSEESAKRTVNIRNSKIEPGGDNYENELLSACVWMSGNIFIGPTAANRVDDQGNDDIDYGGYRSVSQHKKDNDKVIRAIANENLRMDTLKSIHDNIIALLLKHTNGTITKADYPLIYKTLDSLANIARDETTLHKHKGDTSPYAYNIADWVRVGPEPIKDMLDAAWEFGQMYEAYTSITPPGGGIPQNLTQAEDNFYKLFKKHINIVKYQRMCENGTNIRIMAWNTYNVVKLAYYDAFVNKK